MVAITSGTIINGKPIVVLLGNTVLIDSIAISLKKLQNLRVCRIDEPGEDISKRLVSIAPELVIFELETSGSNILFDFLKKQTDISLLGLDQNYSRVIVLNSYQHMTRTMSELVQLIQDIIHEGAIPLKGGERIGIGEIF